MTQNRTHTCNELRLENVGQKVRIVGWMENVREVGSNFAFVVVRDFYGTTQVVIENEELMAQVKGINKESTIAVDGVVRERASKNPKQATGDIEVVPEKIEVLGKCRYNELPFEINRSREADETQRLLRQAALHFGQIVEVKGDQATGGEIDRPQRGGDGVVIRRLPVLDLELNHRGNAVLGAGGEHFLHGRDGFVRILDDIISPVDRKALDLGEGHFADQPFAVGHAADIVVMQHDPAPVSGHADIKFAAVKIGVRRRLDRREGVFRRKTGKAPVGDELDGHDKIIDRLRKSDADHLVGRTVIGAAAENSGKNHGKHKHKNDKKNFLFSLRGNCFRFHTPHPFVDIPCYYIILPRGCKEIFRKIRRRRDKTGARKGQGRQTERGAARFAPPRPLLS